MNAKTSSSTPETELQSKFGEIFRAKVISEFNLLEHFTNDSDVKDAPCCYTSDVIDPEKYGQLLKSHRNGLVRFQSGKTVQFVPQILRRQNRVKNKNSEWPSFDLLAHSIVKSVYFQNFILAVILINSVVLGIQAELSDRNIKGIKPLLIAMDVFDYFSMFMFILEILLKWIDQFWVFWKNKWNVFDFIVTFLTVIPEIIPLCTLIFASGNNDNLSDLAIVATNMRTFRVLRSLKMVSRFNSVKIIVLAVTKAFQAMVFINILLFILAYIFAVMGVVFFGDGYKSAEAGQLTYKNSFIDLGNALITLFQLFTLDHWFDVFEDSIQISNYIFAATYIMLWILIGSFVFKNIFVGIMVNNFQHIRTELSEEMEKMRKEEERELEMVQFAGELEKQMHTKASETEMQQSHLLKTVTLDDVGNDTLRRQSSRFKSAEDMKEALSIHVMKTEKDSKEWQKIVEENIENLAHDDTSFCWPRDTLFQYLLTMEALMENVSERQKLLKIASEALLKIHDN